MNTYNKTKQFTKWLKEMRPDFEIKNNEYYTEISSKNTGVYIRTELEIYEYNEEPKSTVFPLVILCPTITTDTLHAILWELLQPDVNLYNQLITKYFFKSSLLPDNYGAIQPSWWESNPDSVLDDIMNTYKELNK